MSYGIFDSVMLEGEQADAYKAKKAKEAKDKETKDLENEKHAFTRLYKMLPPAKNKNEEISDDDMDKVSSLMKTGAHFKSKNDMNRPDVDYPTAVDATIRHDRKQHKKKSTAKTEYANLLIDSYNSKDIY